MARKEKRVLPPNAALDETKQKEFNQKVQIAKEKSKDGPVQPGVIYLSHLPWGFEEDPIKKFLSQFGTITKVRVSRSKKTGNSRGYAYVQFAYDEVARIVADTMNNYLMFGKLVKCKHLTTVHPSTFKGANRSFRKPMKQENAIRRHNTAKSPTAVTASKKRALTKYRKKKTKLTELGIEYELDDLEHPVSPMDVKEDPGTDEPSEKTNEAAGDDKKSEKPKARPQKRKLAEPEAASGEQSKKKRQKSASTTEKVSASKKGRYSSVTDSLSKDADKEVIETVNTAGQKKAKVTKSPKEIQADIPQTRVLRKRENR